MTLSRRKFFLGSTALVATAMAPALPAAPAPLWGTSRMGSAEMMALQIEANARMQALIDGIMEQFMKDNADAIAQLMADQVIGGRPIPYRITAAGKIEYERVYPPA